MGWKKGDGLGKKSQGVFPSSIWLPADSSHFCSGIIDPIRIKVKEDPLGVGTERVDSEMAESTTAERRRLQSEIQLGETDEQRKQVGLLLWR
jgi:hypothetical protein